MSDKASVPLAANELRKIQKEAGAFEMFRAELTKVAYEFADACVEKAMLRLEQHPERSAIPHREYPDGLHRERLIQEFKEWEQGPIPSNNEASELTDIGNFAAWLYWRLKRPQP